MDGNNIGEKNIHSMRGGQWKDINRNGKNKWEEEGVCSDDMKSARGRGCIKINEDGGRGEERCMGMKQKGRGIFGEMVVNGD